MIHIYSSYVTRSYTVALIGHHELYYRNNYYVTEALYHSNPHVSMTYIYSSYVTMIPLSHQPILRPYVIATIMSP